MERSQVRTWSFWVALAIVVAIIILISAVYFKVFKLHITVEALFSRFYLHHWFSIIGVTFIALFIPAFHYLKQLYPKKYSTLLHIHVFGNLLSVMLVSIHFTQQITRPLQSYPELGTGIVLYPIMVLLIVSGFPMRFRFWKGRSWRFLHTSVAVSFYLVIVVHVLHGLAII